MLTFGNNMTGFRKKYIEMVPESSDLTIIVLKGHLVIEELLCNIIRSHCEDYDAVVEARLTFYQKACIAKGLMSSVSTVCFPSVFFINTLRNDLAHNLESSKRDHLIEKYVSESKSLFGESYNETETIEGRLRNAVCHTINSLGLSEELSLIWQAKD